MEAVPNAKKDDFYCRKCRMHFDSKLKLANHINKFCIDSVYGEPQKLLQKLKLEDQESRNPSHLSFGEVKDYLKNGQNSQNPRIARMSLDDLRNKFSTQGIDQDLELLKSEIIKKRETELIAQLKALKKREKQFIISRQKTQTSLNEKMDIFNKDKETEMKVRFERERIRKCLRNVNEKDLLILNTEKQREIEELRNIKAEIERQESIAVREIQKLSEEITNKENVFQNQKSELFPLKNSEKKGGSQSHTKLEEIRNKIMANAHKHGSYSAKLEIEKRNLQKTKAILVAQLRNKNLNELDQRLVLSNIQNRLKNQNKSIETLKLKFETENMEMNEHLCMHNQLYSKLTTFPDTVDLKDYLTQNRTEKKKARLKKEIHKSIRSMLRKEEKTHEFESDHKQERSEANEVTQTKSETLTNRIILPSESRNNNESTQKPQNIENIPSPQNLSARDNNLQQTHNIPNMSTMHSATHMPPYGQYPSYAQTYPPPMPYPYMMPPPHSYPQMNMSQSYSNAMLTQMNKQFEATQKLLKQHEIETELLQNEIGNIHKKQEFEKTKASKNEFQHTLHMLRGKLMNNNCTNETELSVSNMSNNEMNDFAKEERKLLTLISTFSAETDLKTLYVKQLRSITSTKFELEQLIQHKKMQKIKHEISSYEQQLIAESQHENWLKEQKRLLERKKIEKELAAQGLLILSDANTATKMIENKLILYDNCEGFAIYFDFIIGFTNKYKQCRLATSIINDTQMQSHTLQTTKWEPIYERNKNDYISMIQTKQNILKNVNPSANVKFLIDIQVRDQRNNEEHYLWTILMPLFIKQNDSKWYIPHGLWKWDQFCNGQILIKAAHDTIHKLSQSNQNKLYFRICDTQLQLQSSNTDLINMYQTYEPFSLQIQDSNDNDSTELKSNTIDDNDTVLVLTAPPSAKSQQSHENNDLISEKSERRHSNVSQISEQLYNAQNGIGILVKFMEHRSKYPFSKIKVSIYDMQRRKIVTDSFDNICVWESELCQEGISSLGVYEWEQRHTFSDLPYIKDCALLCELFEYSHCNIPETEMQSIHNSRPLTALSAHSYNSSHTHVSNDLSFENEEMNGNKSKPTLWTVVKLFKIDSLKHKAMIDCHLCELPLYKYPINYQILSVAHSDSHSADRDNDSILCLHVFDPCNAPIIKENVQLLLESNDDMNNGLDTIQEMKDRAWIRVENVSNVTCVFERDNDGIDLYVDGARFLPQNTTITKLYVQLMWTKPENDSIILMKDESGPKFTVCDVLEGSNLNPIFNFRHEFRNETTFENSAFVIFRLDTIERHTKQCQLIGYSVIHLFNTNKSSDLLYLNEGSFQLSLYRQDLTHSIQCNKAHKLPCATLLIRIIKAQKSEDGTTVLGCDNIAESEWDKYPNLIIPSPNYQDRIYDTTLCEPSIHELKIYSNFQNKVGNDKQISLVCEEIFKDEIDDSEFTEWVTQRLRPPPKNEIRFIDLSHCIAYNESMGIALSIEGINNLSNKDTKNCLFIVIYTLCPPSQTFFDPSIDIIDEMIQFTTHWDWSSECANPKFIFHKLHTFKDFSFVQNAILFTDIRQIKFKFNANNANISDLQITKFGFSFFPLFDSHNFVKFGKFTNIVFAYPPKERDSFDILSLINSVIQNGSESVIGKECALTKREMKSDSIKRLKPMSNKCSISVQIYDNQISPIATAQSESQNKVSNTTLIPKELVKDYLEIMNKHKNKPKSSWFFGANKVNDLQSILAYHKIGDQKQFCKKLIAQIAQKLDISHYNL